MNRQKREIGEVEKELDHLRVCPCEGLFSSPHAPIHPHNPLCFLMDLTHKLIRYLPTRVIVAQNVQRDSLFILLVKEKVGEERERVNERRNVHVRCVIIADSR